MLELYNIAYTFCRNSFYFVLCKVRNFIILVEKTEVEIIYVNNSN